MPFSKNTVKHKKNRFFSLELAVLLAKRGAPTLQVWRSGQRHGRVTGSHREGSLPQRVSAVSRESPEPPGELPRDSDRWVSAAGAHLAGGDSGDRGQQRLRAEAAPAGRGAGRALAAGTGRSDPRPPGSSAGAAAIHASHPLRQVGKELLRSAGELNLHMN